MAQQLPQIAHNRPGSRHRTVQLPHFRPPPPAPPAPPLVELGLASLQERARLHARMHTARGAPLCLARCQLSPRLSGTCCRLYCSMGGAPKVKPQWSTTFFGSARSDASMFHQPGTACPSHTEAQHNVLQQSLSLPPQVTGSSVLAATSTSSRTTVWRTPPPTLRTSTSKTTPPPATPGMAWTSSTRTTLR